MTTVHDTITYADGSLGSGTLTLTWPSFQFGGVTITPGQLVFTIAPDGTITIPLYPTTGQGVVPEGVYYTVAYKLNKGPVYCEYWVVPQSPPVVSIGAVRAIPEMITN